MVESNQQKIIEWFYLYEDVSADFLSVGEKLTVN